MVKYYIFKKQPDNSNLYVSEIKQEWLIEYTEKRVNGLAFKEEQKAQDFIKVLNINEHLKILKVNIQLEEIENTINTKEESEETE